MSLASELSEQKQNSLSKAPEDVVSIMKKNQDKLTESGIEEKAPKTGEKLTDFTLPNQTGRLVSLEELRKKGPVVITFYRGGWCPYCNLELRAYQGVLEEIKAAGASLVAITPELPDASLTTSQKHSLGFDVLTDENSKYAAAINIMFTLPEELQELYGKFGHKLSEYNGSEQYNLPLAATFAVDRDGTIVYAFASADYTLRAEPSEIVEVLNTLTDKK